MASFECGELVDDVRVVIVRAFCSLASLRSGTRTTFSDRRLGQGEAGSHNCPAVV
jgi:hypothetical protein